MIAGEDLEETMIDNIWIISSGRPVDLDISNICEGPVSGPVTEYVISELGRYLLDPNPITLEEKIVGCRAYHRRPRSGKIKRFIRKIIPKGKGPTNGDETAMEEIISTSKIGDPAFRDEGLNAHFIKIGKILMPYDPAYKKLVRMERAKIDDVKAVCEDIGRNRYRLNLQGNVNEKINFVINSLSKKARVVFNRAYLYNGLFEMRGFDFPAFKPEKNCRLIKFRRDNQTGYCLLNDDYSLQYMIDDNAVIDYLHLFEQSIKTDSGLRSALALCMKGSTLPLKLFFSKKPEQSYSEARLPLIYREVFTAHTISPSEKTALANALNNFQSIVFFSYIPCSGDGKKKLFTNISVMHDFKALEPIRSTLPEVYSEINKKASVSDAGKLYLLDSLRGYQNV